MALPSEVKNLTPCDPSEDGEAGEQLLSVQKSMDHKAECLLNVGSFCNRNA